MTYEQAVILLAAAQKAGDLGQIPEGVWEEILGAINGAKAKPMPDPDFSLEEMDQTEAVMKSLGPR